MKRSLAYLFISLAMVFLFSCQKETVPFRQTNFFSMDTFVFAEAQGASENQISQIKNLIFDTERTFSRTSDSEISKINSATQEKIYTSDEVLQLLLVAQQISQNTKGAFNFAIEPLVSVWNINEGKDIPKPELIEEKRRLCDYMGIEIYDSYLLKAQGVGIDLGACVKGYAAGKAIDAFQNMGIENAMINLGGNIGVIGSSKNNIINGTKGWNIGIKNPFDTEDILGYVNISEGVIAVSGDYERYFEKDGEIYHHILDSKTGYPAKSGIKSVAVISRDGFLADALSTALFVMGKEEAQKLYESGIYDFEAIFCESDGTVSVTDGIKDSFVFSQNAKKGSGEPLIYK